MSYDLMVFDPAAAPAGRSAFIAWYQTQTDWDAEHDYYDFESCTGALRVWLDEMAQQFPPLNGPIARDDFDAPKIADYSVWPQAIYVAFAWSMAQPAREAMFRLARKHRLGFYDVSGDSGDGLIWTPPAA